MSGSCGCFLQFSPLQILELSVRISLWKKIHIRYISLPFAQDDPASNNMRHKDQQSQLSLQDGYYFQIGVALKALTNPGPKYLSHCPSFMSCQIIIIGMSHLVLQLSLHLLGLVEGRIPVRVFGYGTCSLCTILLESCSLMPFF